MNGIMAAVRTVTREVCGPEHVVMGMTYVSGEIEIDLERGGVTVVATKTDVYHIEMVGGFSSH